MKVFAPIFVIILFFSCSPKPYSATNKLYSQQAKRFAKILSASPVDSIKADSLKRPAYRVNTTNFGMRKPNIVVIHYTAQKSCEQTLQTFTKAATQVSAHYVICKDGTLHHMLNDYLRAWHAGSGKWGNNNDVNSSSIGIEIDNNGLDSFSLAQLNTLYGVLAFIKKAYNIPTSNFIGHSDIAPSRKTDPGVLFPWKSLAEKGYGNWYADTTATVLPADFNSLYALKIIGYDVKDLTAIYRAFRIHFLGYNVVGELTEPEKKILYMLMQKYL